MGNPTTTTATATRYVTSDGQVLQVVPRSEQVVPALQATTPEVEHVCQPAPTVHRKEVYHYVQNNYPQPAQPVRTYEQAQPLRVHEQSQPYYAPQLARQLRAQPETAKALLIAVTGYGRLQDRDDAIGAGFDHHMTKPVETAELLSAGCALPVLAQSTAGGSAGNSTGSSGAATQTTPDTRQEKDRDDGWIGLLGLVGLLGLRKKNHDHVTEVRRNTSASR